MGNNLQAIPNLLLIIKINRYLISNKLKSIKKVNGGDITPNLPPWARHYTFNY